MRIPAIASLSLAAAMVWSAAAFADALAKPVGEVVLTVSGPIAHAHVGRTAPIDLPMLEALSRCAATMETPWTKGKVKSDGPLGRAILDAVRARGPVLQVVALNDCPVDVPLADLTGRDTLLAARLDGRPMSITEKEPVFLVYAFDTEPARYDESYVSRGMWQIKSFTVE